MKGTSERVPNKNLKEFNGKPLYTYILDTLLKSNFINLVVINTDSDNLKQSILSNYKNSNNRILINDRAPEVCGNYVSMNKVLEQDINTVSADIYIQTHSTNPLLYSNTIDEALKKMISFKEKNYENDSIFSVSKIQKRFYNEDATPMNHDPKMLITQHLPPIFEENSCFFIFTKESFFKNESRIGKKPYMYEIDKVEAIDIDEPQDFIIAEALHKLLR